jgi:hypothetical protein
VEERIHEGEGPVEKDRVAFDFDSEDLILTAVGKTKQKNESNPQRSDNVPNNLEYVLVPKQCSGNIVPNTLGTYSISNWIIRNRYTPFVL